MQKFLAGLVLIGVTLGIIGTTAEEKNVRCDVGGQTLQGTHSVYKLGNKAVATHFNYVVTKQGSEIKSFSHTSLIVNVPQNAKVGNRIAQSFCSKGTLPSSSYTGNFLSGLTFGG